MGRFFKVKNFDKFQHYKDRSPPWIKLYNETLENYEFGSLNDATKGQLIGIWLLASRMDNKLPFDPRWIASKINATDPVDLETLYSSGFILDFDDLEDAKTAEQVATPAQRNAKANGFGSRHIPDETRRMVWDRDGGKCVQCGAAEDIEYDHKHPVSKGGNSEKDNIQLLCRPCNRSKRTKVAAHAEQVATPPLDSRSLEREGQDQQRKEDKRTVAKRPCTEEFEEFKKSFPRRDGANPWQPAEKKFNALVKTGVDPNVMIAAALALAREEGARGNIGTKFIPQAITWLNQQRFHDFAASSFEGEAPVDWDAICISYKKTRVWSKHAPGNDPESSSCQCPPEILAKHGIIPSVAA